MTTPHRTSLTRTAAALVVAALLGSTAACGGSPDLSKGHIGTTLADRVKDQKTYGYEVTIGSGGQSRKGTGEVDLSGDKPKTSLELTESGQKATFLAVDGSYYAKIPTLGKKWIKPDGAQGQALAAVLGQFGIADPVKVLSALDKGTKVTKGKTKKVGEEDTTGYTVTIPGTEYAEATDVPSAARSSLPDTVSYLAWVDGDGLLRELDSSFEAQGTKVTLKTVYSDFGKTVTIKAPTASEIGTLPTPSPSASPTTKASPSAGG